MNYSTSPCMIIPNDQLNDIHGYYINKTEIIKGVCSRKTENLLTKRKECLFVHYHQTNLIYKNLIFLMRTMCKTRKMRNILYELDPKISSSSRIVPINTVLEFEDATVFTNLNLGTRIHII